MEDWKEIKKRFYEKDQLLLYKGGIIDFRINSMDNVRNASFRNYDEYLDVQMRSCNVCRKCFEMLYYGIDDTFPSYFMGRINHFDVSKGKVVFDQIRVEYSRWDGNCYLAVEDHVWMDSKPFEGFNPGERVRFAADIYRYMKLGNGKQIDYGLENPSMIEKIDTYEVPTSEQIINQMIDRLVCKTCLYYEQCYVVFCMADAQERKLRFELIKNFLQKLYV